MSIDNDDTPIIETRGKVLRRFYEPLLLLDALGRIRGKHIKPEANLDSASPDIAKLRRSFVDGIAYVCAHKKFPNSVTAAALEKTPEGIVLWLAANGGIKPPVLSFTTELVDSLHHLAIINCKEERQSTTEQNLPLLLRRIVAFSAPRLRSYISDITQRYVGPCLQILRSSRHQSNTTNSIPTDELCQWLESKFTSNAALIPQDDDLYSLVQDSYSRRKRLLFEPLKLFAGQGQTQAEQFEQMYKLLCKLGKHVTVTRKLLDAAMYLTQDFSNGFTVKAIPPSKPRPLPLPPKKKNLESILGRVFSNEQEKKKFWTRLQSLWNADEVSRILASQSPATTIVHAELIVMDYFSRNRCQFLDNGDKYIGASKPACYLCHAYVVCHPGRFAVPGSHQKLYTAWRMPDVNEKDPQSYSLSKVQHQVCLKLIEWVRKDLIEEVESRSSRPANHPDSTIGLTSDLSSLFLQDRSSDTIVRSRDSSADSQSVSRFEDVKIATVAVSRLSNYDDDDASDDGGVLLAS